MREAIPLRRELENSPDTVFAVSSSGSVAYGDVVRSATTLAGRLRERRTQRLLVQSADPVEIVTALLVCSEESIDLVLMHVGLGNELREQLTTDLHVDTTLEASSGCEPRIGVVHEPTARAQGTVTLMTSGTTDVPKLAEHAPLKLVDRILASAPVRANRHGRWLLTYQPTAFAGIQVILTACLTSGTIVVPTDATPAALLDAARSHEATHISGTPTFWRSFLITGAAVALDQLRQVTVGGEATDQATLDRLRNAFPSARISQIYASTEAGALFAVHDGRQGFPVTWLDAEIDGGIRMRIQDDELQVKSPRRMIRYSNRATPVTDDDWLRTGDLVRVCDGRVLFSGRRDSIINVGGMKVFPAEVESFLLGLPGIVEARVRSRPNPITGQVLTAEVVVAPDAEPEATRMSALRSCRDSLPRHQVPAVIRAIDYVTVNPSWKKT